MTNKFFSGTTKSYIIFSAADSSSGANGTWTVPSDWNNASNSIECIGGGGSTYYDSGSGGYAGGQGGGGGAYSRIDNFNLTPGQTIRYQVGYTVGNGPFGYDTWFSTTSSAPTSTSQGVLAQSGGIDRSGSTSGSGGLASNSIGTVKYDGGSGLGGTGSGGGGAGGPNGAGGAGTLSGGGLADNGGQTVYKDASGNIFKLGNGGAIGQPVKPYVTYYMVYPGYGGGAGSTYARSGTGADGQIGLIVIWYSALPNVRQNDYEVYLRNTVVSWEDLNALTSGNAYSWGYNNAGQLGISSTASKSSPTLMGSSSWKMISTQNKSSVGIRSDGTLWAWGDNTYGQLGTNFGTSYSSPIQIGSATTWKTVAMGGQSALAIQTDGKLWFWGNTPTPMTLPAGNIVSTPVQIGSGTIWKSVSNGYYNGAAIQQDGSLWIWGDNTYGQIGNNTSTGSFSSPIQVAGGPWKSVSCQYRNVYAIKTDGSMWDWGVNDYYQIDGSWPTTVYAPRQIGTENNWSTVTGISNNSSGVGIAIKTDGTIWSWGIGSSLPGQGANNTIFGVDQIGTLANWQSVAIGACVAAIKTDGTLWTWGYNTNGEAGVGTSGIDYGSPVQVGSATNWRSVSVSTISSVYYGSVVATTWPSTFYNN